MGLQVSLPDPVFTSFAYVLRSGVAGSYQFCVYFLRILYIVFHSGWTISFPPTVHKGSLFATSLLVFAIPCLFDDSHSDRCEVIAHCGFDLHFPDDEWCWATSHVSVDHLCIFFGKMSVQILCPFSNWIIWGFLLLKFYGFLLYFGC